MTPRRQRRGASANRNATPASPRRPAQLVRACQLRSLVRDLRLITTVSIPPRAYLLGRDAPNDSNPISNQPLRARGAGRRRAGPGRVFTARRRGRARARHDLFADPGRAARPGLAACGLAAVDQPADRSAHRRHLPHRGAPGAGRAPGLRRLELGARVGLVEDGSETLEDSGHAPCVARRARIAPDTCFCCTFARRAITPAARSSATIELHASCARPRKVIVAAPPS